MFHAVAATFSCVSSSCHSVAASCHLQYILGPFLGYNCFGFRHVKVYCNSDNAPAGLIRKIRNVSLYVPGFNCVNMRSLCM